MTPRPCSSLLCTAALLMTFGLAACTFHGVAPTRMDAVRSVAIIGYTGTVNLHGEGDISLEKAVNAIRQKKPVLPAQVEARHHEEAAAAYAALAERLASRFGWRVLSREEVAANADYLRLAASAKPEGSRSVPGILGHDAACKLSEAQRAELSQSLAVEGLVSFSTEHVAGGSSGVIIFSFGTIRLHPRASVALSLFDAESGEPAWRDEAEGEAANLGVEGPADENEPAALLEATRSALEKLRLRHDRARARSTR
ncbi:MAG: hypothetical protein HY901_22900 [Deltaproteobacteria bacterium]|nr:hypothetical protein [Deltaproteobacteria bacterium]